MTIVMIAHHPIRDVRWIVRHIVRPAIDETFKVGRAGLVVQVKRTNIKLNGNGSNLILSRKIRVGLGQDHFCVNHRRAIGRPVILFDDSRTS